MKDTQDLFDSFPRVENGRILLKKMEKKDADALSQMKKSSEVYRYLPTFLAEQKNTDMFSVIRKSYDDFLERRAIMLGIYWKENHSSCGLVLC